MKRSKNTDIIYSLNIDDVQYVANQEIGKKLSPKEIKKLIDLIAEKINWYDAISQAILECKYR